MFGLYDKEGILRYVNSDKDACLAYAELFELNSGSYSLMHLNEHLHERSNINLDLSHLEESSN